MGFGITLTNNGIKDIMKLIKFLENSGILLERTNRKSSSKKGRFLDFLRPLVSNDLPLMKNVLTSLAKSVLVPLKLTAAASAADADIQRKIYGSVMTALILSNEEMNDIMKVVKSLQESGLLTKDVNETIKNEAK